MTSQAKALEVARVLAFAQRLQLAVELPRIAAEVECELAETLGAERVELYVREAGADGLARRVSVGASSSNEPAHAPKRRSGDRRARATRDTASPAAARSTTRAPTRVELALDGASLGWLDVTLSTSLARDPSRGELAYLAAVGEQLAAAVARVRLADERIALAVARERRGELRKRESAGLVASALIHDFKNLMTVIAWRTEALRGGATSGRALDLESADAILEATKRGSALARRLQLFGRRTDPVVETFDLVGLVDEVAMRLSDWLGVRDAIRVEHATASARVVADRWQLARFLIELVLHARDSAPDGAPIRLAVRETESGTELALAPGISAAALERAAAAFCERRAPPPSLHAPGDEGLDGEACSASPDGSLAAPGAPGARIELHDDGALGTRLVMCFPRLP